jgi:hypothetical protein
MMIATAVAMVRGAASRDAACPVLSVPVGR